VHPNDKSDTDSQTFAHDAQRLDNMLRAIQGTLAGTLPSEEKLVRVYCLSLIAKAARNDEWYGEFSRMLPK